MSHLATFILIGLLVASSFQASATNKEAHELELKEIKARILQTSQTLNEQTLSRDKALSLLQQSEEAIGSTYQTLQRLNHQIQATEKTLKKNQAAISTAQAISTQQSSALTKQVTALYKLSNLNSMKWLFSLEELDEIKRHVHYRRHVHEALSRSLKNNQTHLARLQQLQTEYAADKAHYENLQSQHAITLKQLTALEQERTLVVASFEKRLSSERDRLAELQTRSEALEAIIRSLKLKVQNEISEHRLEHPLTWPVKLHTSRKNAIQKQRDGVFIPLTEDTPVRSILAGEVIFSDWLRGYGLLIIVNHSNGLMSLYAHNKSLFHQTGDVIESSELIATSGKSGGQADSGLYFEMRQNGVPVDPFDWCS